MSNLEIYNFKNKKITKAKDVLTDMLSTIDDKTPLQDVAGLLMERLEEEIYKTLYTVDKVSQVDLAKFLKLNRNTVRAKLTKYNLLTK